jgi:hypothetical protein
MTLEDLKRLKGGLSTPKDEKRETRAGRSLEELILAAN